MATQDIWKRFLRRFSTWLVPEVHEVTIERSILSDLTQMARSAHPKEMLAFFASSKGIRHGRLHIDELQLQAYDASDDSAVVFLSNLPMTTSIVGTVHSHPGGSTRPSDADLHLWQKFGFVHAILGEPYTPDRLQFYTKEGRRLRVVAVDTPLDGADNQTGQASTKPI